MKKKITYGDLDMIIREVLSTNDITTMDALKIFVVGQRQLMHFISDKLSLEQMDRLSDEFLEKYLNENDSIIFKNMYFILNKIIEKLTKRGANG